MKRTVTGVVVCALLTLLLAGMSDAQVKWMVGGRLGISLGITSFGTPANQFTNLFINNANTSTSSTSAGLQIGPTAEVVFSKQFAICMELNINTEAGTPIEWANTFKIYFPISGSQIKPYADAGFALLFVTGGPYFGVRAGGGALFPITSNLYIPADLQFGIFFPQVGTAFYIAGTSGVRYVF